MDMFIEKKFRFDRLIKGVAIALASCCAVGGICLAINLGVFSSLANFAQESREISIENYEAMEAFSEETKKAEAEAVQQNSEADNSTKTDVEIAVENGLAAGYTRDQILSSLPKSEVSGVEDDGQYNFKSAEEAASQYLNNLNSALVDLDISTTKSDVNEDNTTQEDSATKATEEQNDFVEDTAIQGDTGFQVTEDQTASTDNPEENVDAETTENNSEDNADEEDAIEEEAVEEDTGDIDADKEEAADTNAVEEDADDIDAAKEEASEKSIFEKILEDPAKAIEELIENIKETVEETTEAVVPAIVVPAAEDNDTSDSSANVSTDQSSVEQSDSQSSTENSTEEQKAVNIGDVPASVKEANDTQIETSAEIGSNNEDELTPIQTDSETGEEISGPVSSNPTVELTTARFGNTAFDDMCVMLTRSFCAAPVATTASNDSDDNNTSSNAVEAYVTFAPMAESESFALTFRYDDKKKEHAASSYVFPLNEGTDYPLWRGVTDPGKDQVCTTVIFDATFKDARPTTCYGWFYGYETTSTLTLLKNIENLNTSQVVYFTEMFKGCYQINSALEDESKSWALDVSTFDTSSATNMVSMFADCSYIWEIKGLDNFDTSKVENMGGMFSGCQILSYVDVSSFTFDAMRDIAKSRAYYSGINRMFENCSKIIDFDFTNWNTTGINNFTCMFNGCSAIREVTIGTNWTLPFHRGVGGCYLANNNIATNILKSPKWVNVDDPESPAYIVTSKQATTTLPYNVDVTTTYTVGTGSGAGAPYVVYDSNTLTLTLCNDNEFWDAEGNVNAIYVDGNLYWKDNPGIAKYAKYIVFKSGFEKYAETTDFSGWFKNFTNLESFSFENFPGEKATSFSAMFSGCTNLTSVTMPELSSTWGSNVTSTKEMFYNCSKLNYINMANCNFSNCTDFSYMFAVSNEKVKVEKVAADGTESVIKANELELNQSLVNYSEDKISLIYEDSLGNSIDDNLIVDNSDDDKAIEANPRKGIVLPYNVGVAGKSVNFDSFCAYNNYIYGVDGFAEKRFTTVNVNNMFYYCKNLSDYSIQGLNADSFTNVDNSIYGSSNISEIVWPTNYTNSITNYNKSNLLRSLPYCTKITWPASDEQSEDAINMSYMFSDVGSGLDDDAMLTLDLSNMDTTNVTNMEYMFAYNSHYDEIILSKDFGKDSSSMNRMFCNITLNTCNFSDLSFDNTTNVESMFANCRFIDYDAKEAVKDVEIDWSNKNTSKITQATYFLNNFKIGNRLVDNGFKLPKTEFISNSTSLYYFASGSDIPCSLDFSGWAGSRRCTRMWDAFSSTTFTSIVFPSEVYFDTYCDFDTCFGYSRNLQTLYLNEFHLPSDGYFSGMFDSCSNLEKIYCTCNWPYSGWDMFYGCDKLVGWCGYKYTDDYDYSDYMAKLNIGIDGETFVKGYFSAPGESKFVYYDYPDWVTNSGGLIDTNYYSSIKLYSSETTKFTTIDSYPGFVSTSSDYESLDVINGMYNVLTGEEYELDTEYEFSDKSNGVLIGFNSEEVAFEEATVHIKFMPGNALNYPYSLYPNYYDLYVSKLSDIIITNSVEEFNFNYYNYYYAYKNKGLQKFRCWNTKADGTGTSYSVGSAISKEILQSSDTIYLYPVFDDIVYVESITDSDSNHSFWNDVPYCNLEEASSSEEDWGSQWLDSYNFATGDSSNFEEATEISSLTWKFNIDTSLLDEDIYIYSIIKYYRDNWTGSWKNPPVTCTFKNCDTGVYYDFDMISPWYYTYDDTYMYGINLSNVESGTYELTIQLESVDTLDYQSCQLVTGYSGYNGMQYDYYYSQYWSTKSKRLDPAKPIVIG